MGSDRDDLIELSEYAWHRLRSRLDGLNDEEYGWAPFAGCRTIRRLDDGTFASDGRARPGEADRFSTLSWRLCHIAHLLQDRRNGPWLGRPARSLGWPDDGTGAVGTAAEVLTTLDAAAAIWHGLLAETTAQGLVEPMGAIAGPYAASTGRAYVLHVLDELIHHGAEAALMRDLYANWPH